LSHTRKPRAHDFRLAYYRSEKAKGNKLTHTDSDYFEDKSSVKIGITWSEEIEPGNWFLNLMQGKFREAVLLCQTKPDESVAIVLPRTFIDRYWHNFSRAENGEMKFTIRRERGIFYIQLLEPVGWVEATDYVRTERVISPEPPKSPLPEYD
jgi:hypothetical protein